MSDSNEKITAPRPTGAGLMGGGGRGGMRGAVESPRISGARQGVCWGTFGLSA